MRAGAAGYTEWLLFHLWKPNDSTNLTCPNITIPDTIIYRWAKPFFWYFTTPQGEILRKSKSRVTHKDILQDFSTNGQNIVASYMSFQDRSQDKANLATVEYFAQESFQDFINNREKALSGILQKWVEPKGKRNGK